MTTRVGSFSGMMGSERGSGEEKDWEESDERLHGVVWFIVKECGWSVVLLL
jgi:hypothetical protein